jgi:dTDP-glucose 4,6-dehydratase
MAPDDIIAEDMQGLLAATRAAVWCGLRGKRIFITGGTGFVGKWLLESLVAADAALDLGLSVTVLTRDAASFRRRHARLAGARILGWHEGDVADFPFPAGRFDFVVSAALPVSVNEQHAPRLLHTAEAGLLHVCEFARRAGVRRLLHVSSGAVYGPRSQADPIGESTPWTEPAANAYTQAKRAAERVCAMEWPFEVAIARCFAFAGPYLEPSAGSAAAQFIVAATEGREIVVQGTGRAVRSYQYPADMARWLLSMLALAPAGLALNIGSAEAVTVGELAGYIASAAGSGSAVKVLSQSDAGLAGSAYVPGIELARSSLDLENTISLDKAIRRTLAWHMARNSLKEATT